MARTKLCHKFADFSAWPIELRQAGKDNFTVRYGLQIDERLSYGEAAAKLGQAVMHALACDGKLDNSERKR